MELSELFLNCNFKESAERLVRGTLENKRKPQTRTRNIKTPDSAIHPEVSSPKGLPNDDDGDQNPKAHRGLRVYRAV